MRSMSRRARWAMCALALLLAVPAVADDKKPDHKKRRSVAECTSFDQRDRVDEDGVDFSVTNTCSVPVSCSLSWALTCAPDSKKRRSRKVDSHAFQLDTSNGITLTASSARCGEDGWSIDSISWSCAPARD